MKVKVRGLVFVGFAAAVFAQSAFATITPNENEKKVVTSKYYVDTTFQEEEDKVTTENIETIAGANDPWESATLYPSMQVVKGAIDDAIEDAEITIQGDTNYTTASENNGTWTVGIDTTKLGTTADIYGNTNTSRLTTVGAVHGLLDDTISGTETDNTVPTSLAVQTYAEATANKLAAGETAGGTIGTNQTDDTKFPTVKNVYEFVTNQGANKQRKLGSTETGLYVGTYSATDADTWKALETAAAANSQASTDYVTIMDNGSGVYQVNIPATQIATTAALTGATATNDTGLVTAGSIRETILQAGSTAGGTINATTGAVDTTVPTTKNVYEFVTNYAQDTYQPRVENNDAGKLMLGYSTQSGAAGSETYTPGWKELSVADVSNGSSLSSTGYVTKSVSGDVYTVNLDNALVTTTGAAINSYNASTNTGDGNDLVTVSAVKQYAGGIIDVANPCSASTTDGHYCALVAKYSATAPNNVEYEWTIMAPQQ